MTGRGFYRMARGWHDHPMFRGERFDQRSAWESLIERAAWKDDRQIVNGRPIDLQRGQLTVSTRFLARAWGWSEAGVRRFLKRLVANQMIATSSDAGQLIVTVVNYAKYQDGSRRADSIPAEHKTGASDAGPLFASLEEQKEISSDVATSDAPPTQQPTHQATHQATHPRGSQGTKRKGKSATPLLQPTHQATHEATQQPTQRRENEDNEVEGRERRATRFPAGALFPDDWRAWAVQERPDLDPDHVFQRFLDYWVAKPGKAGLKLDWTATWRNWVRSERPSQNWRRRSIAEENRVAVADMIARADREAITIPHDQQEET